LFVATILPAKVIMGFVPLPMVVRSFGHLLINPIDLCQPIVTDTFPFYEKGFSKTYPLKPKYLDYYEVGFQNEKEDKFVEYSFNGTIKAEFFWKDKLLFEKITALKIRGGYVEKEGRYFKIVYLFEFFEIPLQGRYKENISVRLTVVEPDEDLKKYGDSIKLFIRVHTRP
jgi:hypothetical protein